MLLEDDDEDEDANDEDVNYGFDDVRRGGAGGAAVDRGQSARPGPVQIDSRQ